MSEGTLIVVQGPTGVGKTALAIEIASLFSTSIVSADSRQFYREMAIGTAVPSKEEQMAVKHWFVQDRSIENPLTAGSFAEEALACLREIFRTNSVAVMAGGSGLYVNSLVYGIDDIPSDATTRNELGAMSLEELLKELQEKDPEYYQSVDRSNRRRVSRAVEVCRVSGRTYSSYRTGGNRLHDMNIVNVALDRPRSVLYERINRRVDVMMEMGLLDEVRRLIPFRNLSALQTVGYRELFSYLDGELSLQEAVDLIKQNTRHYAKRQLTWLRANPDINWFDAGDSESVMKFVVEHTNR